MILIAKGVGVLVGAMVVVSVVKPISDVAFPVSTVVVNVVRSIV